MATLQEVYDRVMVSDEEKAAFAEAAQTKESLVSFLAERGCDASAEEVAAFLKGGQGELTDSELDAVAGGCSTENVGTSLLAMLSRVGTCTTN